MGVPRTDLSPYARSIVPDAAARHPADFYPTPPGATLALLRDERFPGSIWEPACGAGDMARVLRDFYGQPVLATDLHDWGHGAAGIDFLRDLWRVPNKGIDHVITNPPFRLAEQFAWRGLEVARCKVALLCRLMWLESRQRARLFREAPLARVLVFRDRVPFQRGRLVGPGEQGGRMMPYAWFVFEHGHSGPPSLGWVWFNPPGAEPAP